MTKPTVESTQKTITDPILEPYFIVLDQYCFILQETITPDVNYPSSGKTYVKPVGHYSQLVSCLETVAKLKTKTKSYSQIKEYINEYQKIVTDLKTAIKI